MRTALIPNSRQDDKRALPTPPTTPGRKRENQDAGERQVAGRDVDAELVAFGRLLPLLPLGGPGAFTDHICTSMYVHIYIFINTYIYTYIDMHMFIYMHRFIHMFIYMYIIYMYVYIHMGKFPGDLPLLPLGGPGAVPSSTHFVDTVLVAYNL